MRHVFSFAFLVLSLTTASNVAQAQPAFANGIVIDGGTLDGTGAQNANDGRFGFFSDLYYDPVTKEWWALSDRGPGGGTLPYETRLQRIDLNVHPVTGRISQFRINCRRPVRRRTTWPPAMRVPPHCCRRCVV